MLTASGPPATRRTREFAALAAGLSVAVAALTLALTRAERPLEAAVLVALGCVIGWIVAVDIQSLRAPNRIVYASVVAGLAASALLGREALLDALSGGMLAFLLLLVVALLGRGAMGYGDVKAGALCGITTGIAGAMTMLVVAFVAGGFFAAVLLLARVRGRRDVVAFTPFLALGVLAALATTPGYLVA
ncbi:MAG: A24 family peptidase [Dehalococcoidia bacterium]|nr:A24 family peptidase [Dehalococcoidia bacterium]